MNVGTSRRRLFKKNRAPAKLNIRLKVIGRRTDGYHELVSVMVPVSLFDYLEIEMIPSGFNLICQGLSIPKDESNLVHQAVSAFFSATNINQGISIKLIKNIPVAAGLGGGSSDAACTLKALNEFYMNPLSNKKLADLALRLGADIPFFLQGGPCIVRGIGETLEPINKWHKLWYVIIMPPCNISTSRVYANLKLKLTKDEYNHIITNLYKTYFNMSDFLENDLEEVTASFFPVIHTIKERLVHAGAEGALMSGSGPSVFGVFTSKNKALLAKKQLTSQNLGDIFAVEGLDGPFTQEGDRE